MPSHKKHNRESSTTRRTFLSWLWAALGLVALVELVMVGLVFFKRSNSKAKDKKETAMITCGLVDSFLPGSVTAYVRGRFYLVRLADGGFLAVSRRCTHLGCTVPWVEEDSRFTCPCHASAFDMTGSVINAPAPRALDIYPLSIENDTVFVDTQSPIRRSGFKKEQVRYPEIS